LKKAAFFTLGCKVNQYETQALTELFNNAGYQTVTTEEPADIYVINTCTVTSLSDKKSRQLVRRARKLNPGAIVVVTGCYAQLSPDEVRKIEGVQIIAGTSERHRIVDAVAHVNPFQKSPILLVKPHGPAETFENLSVHQTGEMTRAYVKIQDGCNQYCTYCIIPYARGPVRSRESEDVLSEIIRLTTAGYREIVLTGIHLASYGKDLNQKQALIELIENIDKIPGIQRLRLSSLEPTLINNEFAHRLMSLPSLCHHFHLSLQSGCDKTLKEMNRRYTTAEYKNAVEILRHEDPLAAITTDVIAGFPGETSDDFAETLDFISGIGFADIHVFRYSPREGTPAALFPEQVPESEKNRRSRILTEAAEIMKLDYLKQFENNQVDVLFESRQKDDRTLVEGHTDYYVRVAVPYDDQLINQIAAVQIQSVGLTHCRGIVVEPGHV
jgi:threonylcarbamoyladenosine tRNA methylthiotransferase MtaB